jgi:hypothetical protein
MPKWTISRCDDVVHIPAEISQFLVNSLERHGDFVMLCEGGGFGVEVTRGEDDDERKRFRLWAVSVKRGERRS